MFLGEELALLLGLHTLGDDFQAFLAAKRLWEWENAELLGKIGY